MSQWKRLSRKRRASYMALFVFVLATTGWASSQRWIAQDEALSEFVPPPSPSDLDAPLPPPVAVFIQKSKPNAFGNALLSVRLSREQLAAKEQDGTRDFVTIGSLESLFILRDDGKGGDERGGDGDFSGSITIEDSELERRASSDRIVFESRSEKLVPRFEGRAAIGVIEPKPFDFEAFKGGQRVSLDPAVVFVRPEGGQASGSGGAKGKTPNKISFPLPVVPGTNQFQERVLIIRDLGVVTDPTRTVEPCTQAGNPNGVWTFNHLMTQMANPAASGIDPADFAMNWLRHWSVNQNINADAVPSRAQINQLIALWPKRTDGKLDLSQSPLRLLAILPRVDLRRTSGGGGPYSSSGNSNFLDAGEARFVFGVVLKPGWNGAGFVGANQIPGKPAGCRALPFSVIFEYRISKCKCEDVVAWAQRWTELDNFVPGTGDYNDRLHKLTDQFVPANANPRNPNGSSLGQLRTNEIALSPAFLWEHRDFQLTQFPFTFFQETTTEDTPQDGFNNNAALVPWIVGAVKPGLTAPLFEDSMPPVPLFFNAANFMAGHSTVPNPGTFWNAPGLNVGGDLQENWARHRVSRAACSGCHARETGTVFVHVDPDDTLAGLGSTSALPAVVSLFMTGINNLADPANGTPGRNFDDLARREIDIQQVAALSCARVHPINVAHVKKSLLAFGVLPDNLFEDVTVLPAELQLSVAPDDLKRNPVTEVH